MSNSTDLMIGITWQYVDKHLLQNLNKQNIIGLAPYFILSSFNLATTLLIIRYEYCFHVALLFFFFLIAFLCLILHVMLILKTYF